MKILKQLIAHHPEIDRFGDCFRTCVAMILDKRCPTEVPHFYNFMPDEDKLVEADKAIDRYFESQGLVRIYISMMGSISFQQLMDHTKKNYSGLHFIVTVRSTRGEGNHCIVCQDGQVIADPFYNFQYDFEPCQDLDGAEAWGVDLIVARPPLWQTFDTFEWEEGKKFFVKLTLTDNIYQAVCEGDEGEIEFSDEAQTLERIKSKYQTWRWLPKCI